MDIFEQFINELKQIVRNEIRLAVKEILEEYLHDKWLDKKELAEYWKVSTSWIDHKIDEIPHSKLQPIRFKRLEADAWRNGELKKEELVDYNKVNVKSYKKSGFKIV